MSALEENAAIDLRDALFDSIHQLARRDPSVVFLTADMGAWSLSKFREDLPDRFFNMGIAEQNMISVAAGLALAGKRVFAYAIAPFLVLRCLEHVKVDICAMNLPVTLIGGGAGLTYASDGLTHHAVEDVAAVRAMPNLSVYTPSDPLTTSAVVKLAYEDSGPSYIRMDKGKQYPLHDANTDFARGAAPVRPGADVVMFTNGTLCANAIKVAQELAIHGFDVGVIDVFRLKPLNGEYLLSLLHRARAVVTYEEHFRTGGLGTAIAELIAESGLAFPFCRLGVGDEYCFRYGDRAWLHQHLGLDAPTVAGRLRSWLLDSAVRDCGSPPLATVWRLPA